MIAFVREAIDGVDGGKNKEVFSVLGFSCHSGAIIIS